MSRVRGYDTPGKITVANVNTADIIKRTPGTEKLISTSYTFSETRDKTIMIIAYGDGGMLSFMELAPDEVLTYINRLESMIL